MKIKYLLICFIVALSSCQEAQLLNWWPKPTYSPMEHYKAKVMFSGTKECSLERIKWVEDNPPPANTYENKIEAISWLEVKHVKK